MNRKLPGSVKGKSGFFPSFYGFDRIDPTAKSLSGHRWDDAELQKGRQEFFAERFLPLKEDDTYRPAELFDQCRKGGCAAEISDDCACFELIIRLKSRSGKPWLVCRCIDLVVPLNSSSGKRRGTRLFRKSGRNPKTRGLQHPRQRSLIPRI